MGNVYDKDGKFVGSVNGWRSSVYNAVGKKVGEINIFSDKVVDDSNFVVGRARSNGKVYGISGELICEVPFFGFKVHDASGNYVGQVELAGAPDPPPDMQCRGAAALLLLCGEIQKEAVEKVKENWNQQQKALARKWAEEQRLKNEKKKRR